MKIKLFFGHADNGSATAKMSVDNEIQEDFDYVKLVTLLFDNPEASVTAEVAESYNDAQRRRLDELVQKVISTSKGRASIIETDSSGNAEFEELPADALGNSSGESEK